MKGQSMIKKAFNSRATFDTTFAPTARALHEGRHTYRIPHRAWSRCLHQQASERRASSWTVSTTAQGFANVNESPQGSHRSSNVRPKDDTLTDAERAIFQQIYQDAAEKRTQHLLSEEGRIERLIGDVDQEQPPQEPLSTIFDRARDVIERNEETRDAPPGVLDADRRPEADPRRVPPELLQSVPIVRTHNTLTRPELPRKLSSSDRQSLQLALDASVPESVASGERSSGLVKLVEKDAAIVEACSEDTIRVQGLLENAKTDSEIWRVLRTAVFQPAEQFLEALKIEHERAGEVSGASPDKKKKTTKRKKSASPLKSDTASELSSISALSIASSPDKYPQLALPFAVLRANYAHHCWAALRILRVRFPRSPYAPAVLPAIKALGPISYVLGASTQLYNELLFLRWAHYRDLQACADLLAEMLNRGIPTDLWTRAVFRDAARRWLAARKQRKTEGAKPERVPAGEGGASSPPFDASRLQVRPFELAWWSLEGVRSGFKRWETLEVEARRRHKEERERRERALRDAEEEENEGEESMEKTDMTQKA